MLVGRGVEHALRINQVGAVEGDEVIALLGDALQRIHPIMGRGTTVIVPIPGGGLMAAGRLVDPEVPGSPCKALARHDRGIGMQECLIPLIAEWGKESLLLLGGLTEEGKALVGMGRQHDRIKLLPVARRRGDPCA